MADNRMSVTSTTYNLLPKGTILTRPEFFYTEIYAVFREGLNYKIVDTTPGNREAQYQPANGRLLFLTPGSPVSSGMNERITVIYKT